jgi:hypothetical protein
MRTQFTPGPWWVATSINGAVIHNDADTIADISPDLSAWIDNAHLIAASPDLYKAGEEVLDIITNSRIPDLSKARQILILALTKARATSSVRVKV